MGNNTAKLLKQSCTEVENNVLPIKVLAFITYGEFCLLIEELNTISNYIVEEDDKKLIFSIAEGSSSGLLWKKTVKINCEKLDKVTNEVESRRILSFLEIMRIYKLMKYQLGSNFNESEETISSTSIKTNSAESDDNVLEASGSEIQKNNKLRTSTIFKEFGRGNDLSLNECCICMDRKPDVILPCTHNYCLPCIEQWNYCQKNCPLCRESLPNTSDSWVLSEAPDSAEMTSELGKALMKLTD